MTIIFPKWLFTLQTSLTCIYQVLIVYFNFIFFKLITLFPLILECFLIVRLTQELTPKRSFSLPNWSCFPSQLKLLPFPKSVPYYHILYAPLWGFLVGAVVNNLLANSGTQDTWVQTLGWEDPLEEDMATHPVFLPGQSMDREGLWATVHGAAESDMAEAT